MQEAKRIVFRNAVSKQQRNCPPTHLNGLQEDFTYHFQRAGAPKLAQSSSASGNPTDSRENCQSRYSIPGGSGTQTDLASEHNRNDVRRQGKLTIGVLRRPRLSYACLGSYLIHRCRKYMYLWHRCSVQMFEHTTNIFPTEIPA